MWENCSKADFYTPYFSCLTFKKQQKVLTMEVWLNLATSRRTEEKKPSQEVSQETVTTRNPPLTAPREIVLFLYGLMSVHTSHRFYCFISHQTLKTEFESQTSKLKPF